MDEEISLSDVVRVVSRYRYLIAGLTATGALLGLLLALSKPDIYTATVQIAVADGSPRPLAAALHSDEAAYAVIDGLTLARRYETDAAGAREILQKRSSFGISSDNLLRISVGDTDPEFAARLVEAFQAQLATMASEHLLTAGARERDLLERQLEAARAEAAASQGEAAKTYVPLILELERSLELASLREATEIIPVSDVAVPRERSGPNRQRIVLLWTFLGLVVSGIVASLLELRAIVSRGGVRTGLASARRASARTPRRA